MFKVALTHDIDRVKKTTQYFTHSLRGVLNGNFSNALKNLRGIGNRNSEYWNFERIMEIEDKYSVRSSFYFLNEPANINIFDFRRFKNSFGRYRITEQRVADIIKLLNRGNWEIGLHGSFNSFKSLDMLKREKKELESVLGAGVIGIRQHYLNLDGIDTWKRQSEAGFLYDSSFGYTKGIGFKEGICRPFNPFNNRFTVFPLAVMDYNFATAKNKWDEFNSLCRTIEKEGGILVLNWHNCAFSKNDYPGSEELYIECIKRCLDAGGIFKTLRQFYFEGMQ